MWIGTDGDMKWKLPNIAVTTCVFWRGSSQFIEIYFMDLTPNGVELPLILNYKS